MYLNFLLSLLTQQAAPHLTQRCGIIFHFKGNVQKTCSFCQHSLDFTEPADNIRCNPHFLTERIHDFNCSISIYPEDMWALASPHYLYTVRSSRWPFLELPSKCIIFRSSFFSRIWRLGTHRWNLWCLIFKWVTETWLHDRVPAK